MNWVRLLLKSVLVVLIIGALPFLIELLLNSYELAQDPRTKIGAVLTEGGSVKSGLNRRRFNELRFRATGMQIYFKVSDIRDRQADLILANLVGRLRVIQGDEALLAYDFRLEQNLRKEVDVIDALDGMGFGVGIDTIRRFELECRLVPVSQEDAEAAKMFYQWEFASGVPCEFALDFQGTVPPKSQILFSYSKCPRSLLRGTFLERMVRRFKRSNLE